MRIIFLIVAFVCVLSASAVQAADYPMNIDAYCRSKGYTGGTTNIDGTGYGWRCQPGDVSINLEDLCHVQYGSNYFAVLKTPPPGGPYDWVCRDTTGSPPGNCTVSQSPDSSASAVTPGTRITLTLNCSSGSPPTSCSWSGGNDTSSCTTTVTAPAADTTLTAVAFNAFGSSELIPFFVRVKNATPNSIRVVEFYNTALNHYFITAENEEANAVDNGSAGAGWVRTGAYFGAYDGPATGASPVCRFYGNPQLDNSGRRLGPNSHFYTADAAECEAVKKDVGWVYEGVVFYAIKPVNGQCPTSYGAVRRAYNNRALQNDSNHRYTILESDYPAMTAGGWKGEGVVLCAAPESDASATVTYRPNVIVWTGEQLQRITSASDSTIVLESLRVGDLPALGAVIRLFDISFKVLGVTSSGNLTNLSIAKPTLDELFDNFEISGDVDLRQLRRGATLADYVPAIHKSSRSGGASFVAVIAPGQAGAKLTLEPTFGSDFAFKGEATLLFDKPRYTFAFKRGQGGLTGSLDVSGTMKLTGKVTGGSTFSRSVTVPIASLKVPIALTAGALSFEIPLDVELSAKVELAGGLEVTKEFSFAANVGPAFTSGGRGTEGSGQLTLSDVPADIALTAASVKLTSTFAVQTGFYLSSTLGSRIVGLSLAPALTYEIAVQLGSPTCLIGDSTLEVKASAVSNIPGYSFNSPFFAVEVPIASSKKCAGQVASMTLTSASCSTVTDSSVPPSTWYRLKATANVALDLTGTVGLGYKATGVRYSLGLPIADCGPWTQINGSYCKRERGQPQTGVISTLVDRRKSESRPTAIFGVTAPCDFPSPACAPVATEEVPISCQ